MTKRQGDRLLLLVAFIGALIVLLLAAIFAALIFGGDRRAPPAPCPCLCPLPGEKGVDISPGNPGNRLRPLILYCPHGAMGGLAECT